MRRTSWSKDPFARGSFSFLAVDSTPQQRADLSKPVDDRLFFAGEATSSDKAGTAEGARETGQRAAGEVTAVATLGERIAVIGAGMAGLSAARLLTDQGYEVVIIEARARIGGRIETLTDKAWPFPLELGSSFIDNADTNPLVEDLTALGVSVLPFRTDAETRNQAGNVIHASDAGAKALAAAVAWAATQPHDVSLAQALTKSGADNLSKNPGKNNVSDADWLTYQLSTQLEPSTGASTDRLSAWYGATKEQNNDRVVIGGYSKLLKEAATGIDILASSIARRIAYTDNGVSIRLATGESLSADRAIITLPLGVLKTDAIEFAPPLPFPHRAAISSIDMGILDKVWLRFKEPFWKTNATLWTIAGDDSPFPLWVNMEPLTGEPVLMGSS